MHTKFIFSIGLNNRYPSPTPSCQSFLKESKGIKLPPKIVALAAKIGLDERVATGLAARVILMGAGPVSSVITVFTLTRETQGLFYLFGSLVALRSLFELGAGTSVIQISAHARQTPDSKGICRLDPAFVAVVNHWMLKVASVFGISAAILGSYFLISQNHGDWPTLAAWISYLAISTFQFASEGRWGLLEGADRIVLANKLRLRNTLIQYAVQWTLLLSGAGLFAFVGAAVAAYIAQEWSFRKHNPWLYAALRGQQVEGLAHYKSELVTLIKRASQTYLTGYFVFQIQQPICFNLLGADGSARLGFTHTVGMAFISLPTIWVTMNFPRIAHHVADSEFAEARALFKARYSQAVIIGLAAAAFAFCVTIVLQQVPRFSERLLDPVSTAILYFGFAIQTIGLGMTYWPRAFKVEPFVRIAYIQMFATPLFLWFFTSAWGLRGTSIAIASSWIIGLVGIFIIARSYWTSEQSAVGHH